MGWKNAWRVEGPGIVLGKFKDSTNGEKMFWIRILVFAPLVVAALGQEPALPSAPSEMATDSLGRSTPRGTVLGFLGAAHRGDYSAAARYRNTPLQGPAVDELASQLI